MVAESLGRRYRHCTLENFKRYDERQMSVLNQLGAFSGNLSSHTKILGTNLLLYGPVGTGKDHLLAALLLNAARIGANVRWFSGAELIAGAKLNGDYDVLAISDPIPQTDLFPSDRWRLLSLLDKRYRNGLATWATMNVSSADEAIKRYGAREMDRLRENALSLFCNWPSYRQMGGAVRLASEKGGGQ